VVRCGSEAASAALRQHINTSLGAKAASRLGADPVITPHLA
jgi:hypothetical protein